MGSMDPNDRDTTFSVISDDADIGFLDFENEKSQYDDYTYCDGPVHISTPFPISGAKPRSGIVGKSYADPITIKNLTDDPIELWGVKIFSSNPSNCFCLSLMKPPEEYADEEVVQNFVGLASLEDRVLQPREVLTIWLSCKLEDVGMHNAVIHFDVGDEKIERVAFLLADDNVSQALASSKPYSRVPKKKGFSVNQYVPGSRVPRTQVREFRYRLPPFDVPAELRELIENGNLPDVLMEGLNKRNYAQFFSTLLVMEEIHLQAEMRGYDMARVSMKGRGTHFLTLVVPGLAERRPSLVCGDFIFAKPAMDGPDDGSCPFQGYIHRVEADEIYLKFAKQLHQRHQHGDLYNVSFTYNRLNMRRLYQAVHEAETLGMEALFPSQQSRGRVIKDQPITALNQNINREQLCAVRKILHCRGLPPYVIHGPPGTGKTMTIIEAIQQLYKTRNKSRILVCAASNSAADHVLEKLISNNSLAMAENHIFRLNASSRPYGDVRSEFIGFCYFDDMVFKCPPLKALSRYRIIISTYMSASWLYAEGIRRGHFSHIILDEAGQASEPETMVPVANLCHRETVIVLAGDPMQLGPVVFSKEADTHGLGKSYLDRLFEYEFYRGKDENYVTKLIRNYRSHPAILDLPSRLFYKGELIPSKNDDDAHFYDMVDLPNKSFPVLFVGVHGCDEREGSNPSWFNRTEAAKVVHLIRKLRRNADITESDIGVITPYRQQVNKVRTALESMDMPEVKVGSVEQFQGQERKIIIISTVRSTIKHNEFDKLHQLGFLTNPRRFNVAITRAKSLLIVVGNPHIISKDSQWNLLLRYCVDNGSYEGCPLPTLEVLEEPISHVPTEEDRENQYPCTNTTEWKQTECDWGDYIPEPPHDESRWDEHIPEPPHDESRWDEHIPSSSNDAPWGEYSSSYKCGTRWGDGGLNNDALWGEDSGNYNDGGRWDDCKSSDAPWGEDSSTYNDGGRRWGDCNPRGYCKEAEWKEDSNSFPKKR